MYLYVFVFIILSIMGIYTELFSLRMARIAEQQTGAAELVFTWHGAVTKLARVRSINTSADGCSLTNGGNPPCSTMLTGAVIDGIAYLPNGYDFLNYQFTSRLFQTAGYRYVITYIPPNSPAILGYPPEQIGAQIRNARYSVVNYGRVQAACPGQPAGRYFVMPPIRNGIGGASQTQCVPVGLAVPEGAFGFITFL